jgi:hypothetical protein
MGEEASCANNSGKTSFGIELQARARPSGLGKGTRTESQERVCERGFAGNSPSERRGTAEAWRQRAEIARGQASKLFFEFSPRTVLIAGEGDEGGWRAVDAEPLALASWSIVRKVPNGNGSVKTASLETK